MRRIFVLVLLLCLGLAGCGLAPVAEGPVEVPSLPVPSAPDQDLRWDPQGFPHPERGEVPVLEDETLQLQGPAGTVRAMRYMGSKGYDPVYGDVDGDGQTELVYWCYGPTSGLFTVGICVYGLEQGWPVLKGHTILNLRYTDSLGLEADAGQVFFRCTLRNWDNSQGKYTDGETLRLPVTLTEGVLLLNDGELPGEMDLWGGGTVLGAVGSSFSVLRDQIGEEALLDCPSCLVWQKTVVPDPDSNPAGEEITETCAAVTDNGVTVTGTTAFLPPGSGVTILSQWGNSLEPIPPVEDPEALLGLTVVKLTGLLGPYHFDMSSTPGLLIPCWFTEDGKLLIVTVSDSESHITLWDMTAGTPFPDSALRVFGGDEPDSTDEPDNAGEPDDPGGSDETDVVTVHQEAIPTRIENAARWEGFLAAAERGEADGLTLRLVYKEGTFDLDLRFDGEVFTLVDEGISGTYHYLLAGVDDTPPSGARYRRAVHYLLSDDPDLTWEAYFARMVSSSVLFDQAAARGLFTVFDD